MGRRFKCKKRTNYKIVLFLLIFILIVFSLNYIENHLNINLPNKKFIELLCNSNNKYSYEGENYKLTNEMYAYIKKNVFNSPLNLLRSEISYHEESTKNIISFSYVENDIPLVYIYNSHQGENYSREYLEEYNITPNVLMASNMLKDKLENLGITAYVENSDILNYMKIHGLDHSGSYIASRYYLESYMKKNPNAMFYIDLHRDAISHNLSVTTINGKVCAKILFVIGLEYSTYQNNLSIVTKINNKILEKYPTLTRGILKKEGYGVNGVYNQDLASNVILIEIGGNENNIEEVNNTLDLIAEILGEYINEKKEEK